MNQNKNELNASAWESDEAEPGQKNIRIQKNALHRALQTLQMLRYRMSKINNLIKFRKLVNDPK